MACPTGMEERHRNSLARLASDAWFSDEQRVYFDWGDCCGELRSHSEVANLGSFVGQVFEADVTLPTGEHKVRFLVTEKKLESMAGPIPEA